MRPFYRLGYTVVSLEMLLHRPTVEGRENIPAEGCLIVSNHASYMDPTTIGWAIGREIYYLGRKTLFKPPLLTWLLPKCNVLPIDREGNDIAGLRRIIKMLQGGDSVVLFPEGTRSPDGSLQRAEPGAALIAVKAEAPILPVRLFGTFEAFSRHDKFLKPHKIRIVIGKPYRPILPAERLGKEGYDAIAQEMMQKIGELR